MNPTPATKANDPSAPTATVAAMQTAWARITTLMGGTDAMRAAGRAYLPKNPAESEDAYKTRLAAATLYPAFRHTVENLAARPFSEPIVLSDDMPTEMKGTDSAAGWLGNVDLEGRDLQAFALQTFTMALALGMAHILVDYPPAQGVRSRAEEKASGARPYFVMVDPRNVLGWRAERVNGRQTLTMLRLLECVIVADGDFGEQCVMQVRVVEPTLVRIYRQNERKDWVIVQEYANTLGEIALATVYTGRTGFMTAEPPLDALAHMNVEHWQSASEQQNILHVARVPILFAAGFGEGQLTIGANTAVVAPESDAKLTFVEHSGAAIGAGRESILDLELRMSASGAELLVSRPGTKTATEASIDSAQSTSTLGAMVENLEDTLDAALALMAKWAGLSSGGSVELEGDTDALDPLDVQSLVQATTAGLISRQTAFETMRRLGMIDDELQWKEEALRLVDDRKVDAAAAKVATPPAQIVPPAAT